MDFAIPTPGMSAVYQQTSSWTTPVGLTCHAGMKTAVNAQIDPKTLPWQQWHQLERQEEKSSISGTGSQVVWASLAGELQLLWDQQDAQLEQMHPWSFTTYPLKRQSIAIQSCFLLSIFRVFSNSAMSVLLLRKILEFLVSGALAYPSVLNSPEKAGSRDRPWLCLTSEVFSLYITCHPFEWTAHNEVVWLKMWNPTWQILNLHLIYLFQVFNEFSASANE